MREGILHFNNKIEGLTILVCLELERFLRWFLSGNRNEVHFDNKIEGLTILVCMELERFLRWFLSGSILK